MLMIRAMRLRRPQVPGATKEGEPFHMPEGPEIRRAADKIEAVLRHKIVEKLEFGLKPLKRFAKPLEGTSARSGDRRQSTADAF